MEYDLSNNTELEKAVMRFNDLKESKKTIELKGLSDTRTSKQNRALHKFFTIISFALNELGMEFNYTGLKGTDLSTRYTPDLVKEFFWRPIQIALFDIKSTKELTTKQMNDIIDVFVKFFGERGVLVEFPNKEYSD